jgi:DNA-directed RNA polymerase specialized sigma24 family protein
MHIAAAVFMRHELMCSFVNRCWRRRAIFSVHHLRNRLRAMSPRRCATRRAVAARRSVSTPLPPRTDRIRWAELSVQSTAILRQVVAPIHLESYSTTDVAKRLGIPLASVRLLTELGHDHATGAGDRLVGARGQPRERLLR